MNPQFPELQIAVEAGRPTAGSLDRLGRVGLGVGIAITVALGVFGRFSGLGSFPLAVDEYYFVQSVRAILEHGVPAFETGGYYSRGLVPQYMTAASVLLFGENGFAYRLPAALFSLGTVPLAYVYGRRILGAAGGLALAVLLLVSAWEIEFGRFARMYSGLQFFTILFFIALDRTVCAEGSRRPYLAHVVLLVAILTHELAILLLPLLILPLVAAERGATRADWRRRLGYAAVTVGVALLCYYYFTSDLRDVGVANSLPDDYQSTGGPSRWRLPTFLMFGNVSRESLLLLYLGSAAAIAAAFVALQRLGRPVRESALLGALLVLSAAFHQFFLAGLIVLVLAARHRIVGLGPEHRVIHRALAATAILGGFWLAYALVARESVVAAAVPGDGVSKAIARTLFGWPDITSSVIGPWRRHLPLAGACAMAALLHQLLTKARGDVVAWIRNPAIAVVPVVLAFGMINQAYASIRYSFFLYPFVLALILISAIEAAAAIMHRLNGDQRLGQAVGIAACLCVFGISSDFNLRQIMGVAGENVRLRLGEFERYQGIWYDRLDYETPALFVNEHAGIQKRQKVLVVGQPPVSYYLTVPHGVYYDRKDPRFYGVSRRRGTVDIWSNQRLLSTPNDLREYTRCAANVWIVRATPPAPQAFDVHEVWGEQVVRTAEAFRSVDRRLEVRLVELETGNGC